MILGRGLSGFSAQAALNLSIRPATSPSPSASGVTCTLQLLATANECVLGSRAAIHIGGYGCWIGRGTAVVVGNWKYSPLCA